MKQSDIESILAKVEASLEASHRAQIELLKAVRLLFVETQATAEPKTSPEIDPDVDLAALDDAAFDGLPDVAVFTVEEVAGLFRVAKSTIYRMVEKRQLPALTLGRKIRIPRRALVAHLRGMDADDFDLFIRRKAEERYGK